METFYERFSEDIDLTLDKKVLGIDQVQTKKQVKTLRSKSKKYISGELFPSLKEAFNSAGFNDLEMRIAEKTENDPLTIEIYYPNIVKYPGYIKPRILIEIGCRSLKEPYAEKTITSFLTEIFANRILLIPQLQFVLHCHSERFWKKYSCCMKNFKRKI